MVPAQGGTGLSSYAVGDLVYASGSTTLAKLADVAVGQVLVSGGVATAPAYSASPSITALTYTTNLKSTTALATPAALTATQATAFASTVSGSAIMGFGTTNDVSLMNRAGTVVLGIGPNTTTVNMTGALTMTGLLTVTNLTGPTFRGDQNAVTETTFYNATSGTAGSVNLQLLAGTSAASFQLMSQGFTTSGIRTAAGALLQAENAGGLSIAATHASGAIRFYSGGTTLRWEILTGGTLRSGTSAAGNNFIDIAPGASGTAWGVQGTDSRKQIMFYNANGEVGSISTSGSATSYTTSSDERLKRDLGVVIQTDVLRKAVIRDFEWLADGSRARGVFAQEAHATAPFAVSIGGDEMKDGHLAKPWSVDYSKYVPDLIVGWQQHDATISQLAARIAALEGRQ